MATKLGLDRHNQKETTGIGAELGGIVASGTAWIEALRAKLRLTAVTSTDGWARAWASRAIAAASAETPAFMSVHSIACLPSI